MRNDSYFQGNPVDLQSMSRSVFSMPHKWTGTLNTGKLVPFFSYGDVLPGDTWNVDASFVMRSTTPMAPVMDDAYVDVFFFFTPHKLVLSRAYMSPSTSDSNHSFAAAIGAQDSLLNMPIPQGVTLPDIVVNPDGRGSGRDINFIDDVSHSLVDYLGLSLEGVLNDDYYDQEYSIVCLEPLAYYSIYNEYFRDPNVDNPVVFSISSGHVNLSKDGSSIDIVLRDSIMDVCVFHGYFGSALPWPQRGAGVTLPLGDVAPVFSGDDHLGNGRKGFAEPNDPVRFGIVNSSGGGSGTINSRVLMSDANHRLAAGGTGTDSGFGNLGITNLWANLADATAASINNIRLAFQYQRFQEKMARGGNRIQELTRSMFGVTPHDYTDDRPEYLGGARVKVGMHQVNNTAGTTESTASQQSIGSTGAYSLTSDSRHYFVKSFDTWGTITGVMCVRVDESFSQGLPRRYSRRKAEDFYWPTFAFLGEQPIFNKEIFLKADNNVDSSVDDGVFGYQEAWAEYRYIPDVVSGFARPGAGYDYWNYSNRFTSAPLLKAFLHAGREKDNVDRTLQVQSKSAGFQWMAQFLISAKVSRVMPLYSVPGLVDHF